jgi:peptidoglycan hydrolase CwlO-like protein
MDEAEIERLRKDYAAKDRAYRKARSEAEHLADEIERLQEELAMLGRAKFSNMEQIAEQEEKIERLQAELKDANGIIRSQTISFRKHQAELRETATQEIERLKGELE